MKRPDAELPDWPGSEWARIASDGYLMLAEASAVIWLRTMRLMSGDETASREATLMVNEKLQAGADLAMKFITDPVFSPEDAARRTVTHYGRKVNANRKRLSKARRG